MNLTLLDRLDEEWCLGRGGVKGEGMSLDLTFNCGKQIQTSNYLLENTPVAFKHWVMTLNIWTFWGEGKKKEKRPIIFAWGNGNIHHLKKIALAADSAQVERSRSIPLCKIKRGQQKAAITVVPADLRNRKIQFPAASQLLSKQKSQQEVGYFPGKTQPAGTTTGCL